MLHRNYMIRGILCACIPCAVNFIGTRFVVRVAKYFEGGNDSWVSNVRLQYKSVGHFLNMPVFIHNCH